LTSGVVIIDKPSGPTSHDIVARIRKKLKTREVGHAGTLDPMATGVLVVAIGEATKLVPYLTASDKTYEATIQLGIETDTLDAEGKEISRAPIPSELSLDEALEAERRRTKQIPPSISAIHVDGQRAHERARRGELVELEPRDVEVRSLDLVRAHTDTIDLILTVSKGYYVRALARDLAHALGTVGHLTRLRRTRSGSFDLEDACTIDSELEILALAKAASRALPTATLTTKGTADAKNGRPISLEDIHPQAPTPHAWLDESGALVAIGEIQEGVGRVLRGFR
jgi:tRNA pseudouridine55 synthase